MTLEKMNCWEYMGCGLEPGGGKVSKEGACPAAADSSYSGINSGKNAGRFCWAVTGTLCDNKCQNNYVEKRALCQECDFFNMVVAEEGTLNLRTKFLKFVPGSASARPFLKDLSLKSIQQGHRFVVQGKEMDEAYIIRTGSCIVLVERNGVIYPADHRSEGDIVNMSALFTGEPSMAHVEAETDIEAWVIKKSYFEAIPENDPDLWDFLTEIVADRFDSKRPTSYRTIDRYLATDIIGRGGYSIVYKGRDISDDRPIAIKMMRHNMVMDSDFLLKLRNEAAIIGRLAHENIIKVFDMVERYRTVFIIMEYLEGKSILDKLEQTGKIAPDAVLNYLIQAIHAIDYAHSKGILHKDINPGNLMVLDNGKVKLLDFGLACSIHEDDDLFDGALFYLAPELLEGEAASLRSEIYALGTSAFEMVVGHRPYPEDDPALFFKMRCSEEIPDPERFIPEIPRSLKNFIVKACRVDSNERYATLGDAIKEINGSGG